jgi:hypothetical protein
MEINFSEERWQKVKDTYSLWWEGKLGRPIIPVELTGLEVNRPLPSAPLLSQATCADLSYSPEEIVDRIDYDLSSRMYLGDAFPYINLDCFGPGVVAAFAGAKLDNSSGRVWFHPAKDLPISELHLEYDSDNIWLKRVKDVYIAGMEKWKGQVLLGMPDLGGTMDILSSFRPGEELLYDLYDEPDEVKRVIGEIHELWHKFYQELEALLKPVNPGYTDWGRIYSDRPCYMLQCDFAYMISPSMFDEFVKNELSDSCKRMHRSFYHLDGKGELPHLDSILSIKELTGVQWVPGDGNPPCECWPEVYKKIYSSGKKIQTLAGSFEALDSIIGCIGDPGAVQQINICRQYSPEVEKDVRRKLNKYGI